MNFGCVVLGGIRRQQTNTCGTVISWNYGATGIFYNTKLNNNFHRMQKEIINLGG